jgi:hypothetical protein
MTVVSYSTIISGGGQSGKTTDLFVPSTANLAIAQFAFHENVSSPQDVSAVSYAGQDMTLISNSSARQPRKKMEFWQLVNPLSGSTESFEVHYTGDISRSFIGWYTIDGADTGSPVSSATTANHTTAQEVTLNVATAAGELVLDAIILAAAVTDLAPGADQTSAGTIEDLVEFGSSYFQAVGTESLMTWNWINSQGPVQVAVSLARTPTTIAQLQDSFTFSDAGLAQYSDVVTIVDGTPGFDDGISSAVNPASGIFVRTLTDSFTHVSKFVRTIVGDRQLQDTATYEDAIASDISTPLWRRSFDKVRELWSRSTDIDRETWA